ncbi:MAG TPA: hypothetical protein VIF37_13570 [Methylobacter sp.]|jgi:hypothetical protein
MKRIILCVFLLLYSTTTLSRVYKCKKENGEYVYSGRECPQDHVSMAEEAIALTGQRKLTEEQVKIINEHHKIERDNRKQEEAKQQHKKDKSKNSESVH